MGLLTDFEKRILELSARGATDYKTAKDLDADIKTVSRSHQNALRKLQEAEVDLAWAKSLGLQDFKQPRRAVIKESPELRAAF